MLDVTRIASKAGLKIPTLVSPAVWEIINEGMRNSKQYMPGRLWFMLHTLALIVGKRKAGKGGPIHFSLKIDDMHKKTKLLRLTALVGCSDAGQPSFSIVLPNEEEGRKMERGSRCLLECDCFKRMCRFYGGVIMKEETGLRHVCIAFPEGIPEEIWQGRSRHLESFPEQRNDVVFQKAVTYQEMEMFKSKKGIS